MLFLTDNVFEALLLGDVAFPLNGTLTGIHSGTVNTPFYHSSADSQRSLRADPYRLAG